jgi:hypothetical protein
VAKGDWIVATSVAIWASPGGRCCQWRLDGSRQSCYLVPAWRNGVGSAGKQPDKDTRADGATEGNAASPMGLAKLRFGPRRRQGRQAGEEGYAVLLAVTWGFVYLGIGVAAGVCLLTWLLSRK